MDPELLVPLAAIVLIFGIPIVAILTSHQRKMAELIHGKGGVNTQAEVHALRQEVAILKDRVNQTLLANEELRREVHLLTGAVQSQNAPVYQRDDQRA